MADWFYKMTPEAQKAYLKAHPNSKMKMNRKRSGDIFWTGVKKKEAAKAKREEIKLQSRGKSPRAILIMENKIKKLQETIKKTKAKSREARGVNKRIYDQRIKLNSDYLANLKSKLALMKGGSK